MKVGCSRVSPQPQVARPAARATACGTNAGAASAEPGSPIDAYEKIGTILHTEGKDPA
ncbi:MAG TPA: hypothetical protein VL087_06830 [Nitrospirota bacterium]|nr:hypothetical protein [Nitrospirota bacterium]